MNRLLISVFCFCLFSCGQKNGTTSGQATGNIKLSDDDFAGSWASVTEKGDGSPISMFIEKKGDIYNCYFIESNGTNRNFKGIVENNVIKIGKDFTIKYLENNKELYLVENGMEYQRMQSISATIDQMKKEIKDNNGGNLYTFLYIPFNDDYATAYNKVPNYSMTRQSNIGAGVDNLFDQGVKTTFLSAKLVSHYDLDKNGATDLTGNWLLPWEYQLRCKNSLGRDLTFVFSIRNNEYKMVRIQYFE
ncbi:MAG: hypothetical protein ACHQF4_05830 [Sphingobacteriales bacterium]